MKKILFLAIILLGLGTRTSSAQCSVVTINMDDWTSDDWWYGSSCWADSTPSFMKMVSQLPEHMACIAKIGVARYIVFNDTEQRQHLIIFGDNQPSIALAIFPKNGGETMFQAKFSSNEGYEFQSVTKDYEQTIVETFYNIKNFTDYWATFFPKQDPSVY